MSAVLDFFRQQDPRFNKVPDGELTKFIGDEHPEFLADPQFNADYGGSFAAVAPGVTPQFIQQGRADEKRFQAGVAWQDEIRAQLGAEREAEQRAAEVQAGYDQNPIAQVLKPIGRGGQVVLAATADAAPFVGNAYEDWKHILSGKPRTEEPAYGSQGNLKAYAQHPDQPLPVEDLIQETHGLGRVSSVMASAGAKAVPMLAGGVVLGAAGAPGWAAAALPMGVTQEGGFDPIGAAIAAGLPGVSKWGERFVADYLSKIPTAEVVVEMLGSDPLKLKGRVIQKLGGLELSNDAFRKHLETGGGALAANAYLLATQTPGIMALPAEQRGEAIMDAVAGNIATSLMGFASRKGPSLTLEGMFPKLRQQWAEANAPEARRPLGQPAEEGASVPEPGDNRFKQLIAPERPKISPTQAFQQLRQEGVSEEDATALLQGQKTVQQVVEGNQAIDRLTGILQRAGKPFPSKPQPQPQPIGGVESGQETQGQEGVLNPPPEAPVQNTGPVPSPPSTVEAQAALALDPNSTRAMVHVTPGETMPDPIPYGLVQMSVGEHGTLLVNPNKAQPGIALALMAQEERHGKLLGFGSESKPEGGEHVVQTRNAAGIVVQEELVTPETKEAALEAAKRAVPGGTSEIISAWEAIRQRKAAAVTPPFDPVAAARAELAKSQARAAGIDDAIDRAQSQIASSTDAEHKAQWQAVLVELQKLKAAAQGNTPVAPAPPVQPTTPQAGVVYGKAMPIKGANKQTFAGEYAYVPFSMLHASHHGPMFSSNPEYAPLTNTRDYSKESAEQEKILIGAQSFDPGEYLSYGPSAAVGPLMVAPSIKHPGKFWVLGGNGRKQMLDRLNPEQWREVYEQQRAGAEVFGLPPNLPDGGLIVRVLPNLDLETPEGIQAARRIIDALNPSPSLGESTQKLAENDVLHVPIDRLQKISTTSSAAAMRNWLAELVKDNIVDRNTRIKLLNSESETVDYVSRLLIQAAFHSSLVNDLRANRFTPATISNLVDFITPVLINLRSLGAEGKPVADSWSGVLISLYELQRRSPERKMHRLLQELSDQVESSPTEVSRLGRSIAAILAAGVEITDTVKRGPVINEAQTTANWREFLDRMNRIVTHYSDSIKLGGMDIFGAPGASLLDTIRTLIGTVGGEWNTQALRDRENGYRVVDSMLDQIYGGGSDQLQSPGEPYQDGSLQGPVASQDVAQRQPDRDRIAAVAGGTARGLSAEQSLAVANAIVDRLWELRAVNAALRRKQANWSERSLHWTSYQSDLRYNEGKVDALTLLLENFKNTVRTRRGEVFTDLVGERPEYRPSVAELTEESQQQMNLLSEHAPYEVSADTEKRHAIALLKAFGKLSHEVNSGKLAISHYAAAGRKLIAEFKSLFERQILSHDDLVQLVNDQNMSMVTSIAMQGYQQAMGYKTIGLEFEDGAIMGSQAGDMLTQRRNKPRMGKFTALVSVPDRGATRMEFSFARNNPIYIRQATRNELKAALGPGHARIVAKAMDYSLEEWLLSSPRQRAQKQEAPEIYAAQAEQMYKAHQLIQKKLGLMPAQFWRAVRLGDLALVNHLAQLHNPERQKRLSAGQSMGPIPDAKPGGFLTGGPSVPVQRNTPLRFEFGGGGKYGEVESAAWREQLHPLGAEIGTRWQAIENEYIAAKAASDALPSIPLKDIFGYSIVDAKSGELVTSFFVPRDKQVAFGQSPELHSRFGPGYRTHVTPGYEPIRPQLGEPTFTEWLAKRKAIPPAANPDQRTWGWMDGGQLQPGDVVRKSDGKTAPVSAQQISLLEGTDVYALSQGPNGRVSGVDPRVKRYKELVRLRDKTNGKLTPDLELEITHLEESLGQNFMAFFATVAANPAGELTPEYMAAWHEKFRAQQQQLPINQRLFWHGSEEPASVGGRFSLKKHKTDRGDWGRGVYLTEYPGITRLYGTYAHPLTADVLKTASKADVERVQRSLDIGAEKYLEGEDRALATTRLLQKEGFDSAAIAFGDDPKNISELVVFDPSKIKSATSVPSELVDNFQGKLKLPKEYAREGTFRLRRRLKAVGLLNAASLLAEPGQMSLMSWSEPYLYGLVHVNSPTPNNEIKINTLIEGPRALAGRRNRQVELAGLFEPEPAKRSPLPAGSPAVITARENLIPGRGNQAVEWFQHHQPLKNQLYTHQQIGVSYMMDAIMRGDKFGLFDGTGGGKTRQLLAAAWLASHFTQKPSLIITERQAIIDDAFAKDAEALGLPIWQYRGQAPTEHQRILLGTYFDVGLDKIKPGDFTTIFWDEAHNLRNTDDATKSKRGIALVNAAARNVFATATPLDMIHQLWYLAGLLRDPVETVLRGMGVIVTYRKVKGVDTPVYTTNPGVTQEDIANGLEAAFDQMYERGLALKREVPLDGLEVFIKRVTLSEAEERAIHEVMAAAKKYYEDSGVPASTIKALVLMVGRQAAEKHKVPALMENVAQSLKDGRKVVIFGYRVNDGKWVTNAGLEAVADMLERRHGRGSVGRLFGGGDGQAAQKYRATVMEEYNHGDVMKIIVAHPQQGATGINLDDIYGDRPRDTYLLTPPFSALEAVQIAGRTVRLTTRSKSRLFYLATTMRVDTWNLGITMTKLRNLHAVVKGDVDLLEPRNVVHEPTQAYQAEASKTHPDQLEFEALLSILNVGNLHAPADSASGQHHRPRPALQIDRHERESLALTASVVLEAYRRDREFNFIGQKISDLASAAVVIRAIRSRSVETFGWLFARGGEVVDQFILTKHMPDEVLPLMNGQTMAHIVQLAAACGADGVYPFHNHPSGVDVPSRADREVTRWMSGSEGHRKIDSDSERYEVMLRLRQLLRAHIVINHGRFSVIHPDGTVTRHNLPHITGPDPLLDPKGIVPALRTGERIAEMATGVVAAHMMAMVHDPEKVTLLFVDAQNLAVSVAHLGTAEFNDPNAKRLMDRIRETAIQSGAVKVFGYHDGAEPVRERMERLVGAGAVTDSYLAESKSPLMSIRSDLILRGRTVPSETKTFLGRDRMSHPEHQPVRLAENSEEYRTELQDSALTWTEPMPSRGAYPSPLPPRTAGTLPRHVKITFGGMNVVRPVEMPELLKLVTAITGDLPKLSKLRKALGQFDPNTGEIRLDRRIFKDHEVATRVLAHELGHAIDWLPDQYLQRGNLLGRLFTLRNHLKNTFGMTNVKNKELREELIAVTHWWKPFDPALVPQSYTDYRHSGVELYADTLSVLLNSPGELQKRAPKFYGEFWDALDRKPEVKKALFDLQDFLSLGKLSTAEAREASLLEGFTKGEELWKTAVAERKRLAESFDGFWVRFWQSLYWQHYPGERMANQAEKASGPLPAAKDPRVFFDDLGYRDNKLLQFGRVIEERVERPILENGLTLPQAGLWLFYNRVLHGDRTTIANPDGIGPVQARLGLLKMRLDVGMPRMTVLEQIMDHFHAEVFRHVETAVEAGVINRKTFETRIKPNKDHYATFAVLDKLDDYISPGIKQQLGTFKRTANPLQATILKTIGLINLTALNRSKRSWITFSEEHFPGSLEKYPHDHEPPRRKGWGTLMLLEDGSPAWYYADKYVSDMFAQMSPAALEQLLRPLTWIWKKIYPLIITYNTGFGYVLSPLRDIQRTTRNLPGVPVLPRHKAALATGIVGVSAAGTLGALVGGAPGAMLGGLVGAAGSAWLMRGMGGPVGETAARFTGPQTYTTPTGRTYTGVGSPLMREMEGVLAIGTPFDQFARQHRDDFLGEMLKRMRTMSDHEQQGWLKRVIWSPARTFLDHIELGSLVLDQSLKTEAYVSLRNRSAQTSERRNTLGRRGAAHQVRNYVGLPNINKRGGLVRVIKPIVPFFNVAMQGWRADIHQATDPTTRAGWWLKYSLTNGLLRAILAAAAAGAFGAAIKELFDGISEYYKSNYIALPVGVLPSETSKQKIVMLTIPEDETARVLGAIISKTVRAMGPDEISASGLADFTLGQFPSVNPTITVPAAWATLATGRNPVDALRGNNIVPKTEFAAGGLNTIVPMAGWTLRQTGVLNFFRYDPKANSTTEISLGAIPGANKFVRVSEQGYLEQTEAAQTHLERLRAIQLLALPVEVQSLYHEFWHLQSIKPEAQTPQQEERLADLKQWHTRVYLPAWEEMNQAREDKRPSEAEAARRQIARDSVDFVRKR